MLLLQGQLLELPYRPRALRWPSWIWSRILAPPAGGRKAAGKIKTVVLIGPPNCGKSTLFNRLTGLRQKVANYPGVTVEQHFGRMNGIGRKDLLLVDLPGIYSLDGTSEDARVSVEVLHGRMPGNACTGCGAAGAGCRCTCNDS